MNKKWLTFISDFAFNFLNDYNLPYLKLNKFKGEIKVWFCVIVMGIVLYSLATYLDG